jgi:hypothetical protein
MSEPRAGDQSDEQPATADVGSWQERINDPLARTDVEAPRLPFQAAPPSEE